MRGRADALCGEKRMKFWGLALVFPPADPSHRFRRHRNKHIFSSSSSSSPYPIPGRACHFFFTPAMMMLSDLFPLLLFLLALSRPLRTLARKVVHMFASADIFRPSPEPKKEGKALSPLHFSSALPTSASRSITLCPYCLIERGGERGGGVHRSYA